MRRLGGRRYGRWTGTHRDEYFFTTDVKLSLREVIELYTACWSIETTFQEMRSYLGLETTRGRTKNTVLRAAPCLFGLYSAVALFYASLPARGLHVATISWSGKTTISFSDAMTTVRRWIWPHWFFETHHKFEIFIDSEVVNDPHFAANAAVPAGFATFFSAERFIGNLGLNRNLSGDFQKQHYSPFRTLPNGSERAKVELSVFL